MSRFSLEYMSGLYDLIGIRCLSGIIKPCKFNDINIGWSYIKNIVNLMKYLFDLDGNILSYIIIIDTTRRNLKKDSTVATNSIMDTVRAGGSIKINYILIHSIY